MDRSAGCLHFNDKVVVKDFLLPALIMVTRSLPSLSRCSYDESSNPQDSQLPGQLSSCENRHSMPIHDHTTMGPQ